MTHCGMCGANDKPMASSRITDEVCVECWDAMDEYEDYMKEEGIKHDEGKLQYDLVEPGPLREIVRVLTYGASEYTPGNWKYVGPGRYRSALMRHYESWRAGELHDPDTGIHHLAHVGCNVLFLLWFELNHQNP